MSIGRAERVVGLGCGNIWRRPKLRRMTTMVEMATSAFKIKANLMEEIMAADEKST